MAVNRATLVSATPQAKRRQSTLQRVDCQGSVKQTDREPNPDSNGFSASTRPVCTPEPADKPDSVSDSGYARVSRGSSIWDARYRAPRAAYPELDGDEQPPASAALAAEGRPCLALLPVGFARPGLSPAPPVVSYTTFSPLRAFARLAHKGVRGLFSVALCRRVTPPGR